MTATHVDGKKVVSDEPRTAPFADRAGNPIYQPQTRVLTLDDSTIVYGCAHCDYTSSNPNSIRPHLSKHNSRRTRTSDSGVLALPLAELMARLDKLDAITEEAHQWKARALAAERRLKQLRTALGPVG